MPDGLVVYRFGAFEFDPESRTLSRVDAPGEGGTALATAALATLSVAHSAILVHLLTHAGPPISKDALIEAGWPGVAVAENSLNQAIRRLRAVLGTDTIYIETLPGHGFRFVLPVERAARIVSPGSADTPLEPFLTFVQGRTRLETLDRESVRELRGKFAAALREVPTYVRGHVLLAQACGLAYEASATDERRDTAALQEGIASAEAACALDPSDGEAWGTLAFLLDLSGCSEPAIAAATKAITLEPKNWRHQLQLAKVSWGEERLQAARRALALQPGLALVHWLRATVFIARGAFDMAESELRPGCAAQDAQADGDPFAAVGLHLLDGLVLAAQDRLGAAEVAIKRELEFIRDSRFVNGDCPESRITNQESRIDSGQVYARVCAANAWYSLGAILHRQGKRTDADDAFARALVVNPSHVPASVALRGEVPSSATGINVVIGRAILLARGNRHEEAARLFRHGLAQAPPGHAGWILPVEPMLNAMGHRDCWDDVLARVRMRAL